MCSRGKTSPWRSTWLRHECRLVEAPVAAEWTELKTLGEEAVVSCVKEGLLYRHLTGGGGGEGGTCGNCDEILTRDLHTFGGPKRWSGDSRKLQTGNFVNVHQSCFVMVFKLRSLLKEKRENRTKLWYKDVTGKRSLPRPRSCWKDMINLDSLLGKYIVNM
jgi:hypothetical protein